jgi:predicted transcriptional regulator
MAKAATRSVTVTAKVSPALGRKLAKYAKLTEHTTSGAIERVLSEHIDYEMWFVGEVRKGLEAAKRGELLSHESAMRQIRTYVAEQKQKRAERRKAA